MESSSSHLRSMEFLDLQVYDEDFKCSICDFKCSSGPMLVQHYEAHKDATEVVVDDLNSNDTNNFSMDLENENNLVEYTTSTILGLRTDVPAYFYTSVKEELISDADDSNTVYINESIKNENTDMVLLKETEMYNEIKNKIFNEDNYIHCSFKDCNYIIYVEHLGEHIQNHQSGHREKSCDKDKKSVFLCTECGQKHYHFSKISNHILIHFKEKSPYERVCTVCGYRSKRLSSFKIHKCSNLKVIDNNIAEATQQTFSVTYNKKVAKEQRGILKMAVDKEYEPYDNSDDSDILSNQSDDPDESSFLKLNRDLSKVNSEISEDYVESRDSNHLLPKTYTHYTKKKKENIKEPHCDDKDEIVRKDKDMRVFYRDRIAKMKVSCKLCNKMFDNEALCKEHLNSDQNYCQKEEKIANLWRKEISKQSGILLYLCLKCNKSFDKVIACKRHIAVKHTKIRYYCDQCNFGTCRQNISNHIKFAHTIERPICTICNRTYKNKQLLQTHMLSVHFNSVGKSERIELTDFYRERIAKMKVSCKICNKLFDNETLCKEHLNSDQNDCEKEEKLSYFWREEINKELGKPFYVCLKCNKYFYDKWACEKHVAVEHTNIQYYCDQCEYVTCRRNLSRHIRTAHATIQPTCTICNKTYKNRYTLKNHMRVTHSSSPDPEKEKSSLCTLCGKVFSKRKLVTHMLIHTGKKHACTLCEFSTVQKYNLTVHMRSHEKKGSVIYKRTQQNLINADR